MIAYAIKKQGETDEKLILRYKKTFFQTRTANRLRARKRFTKEPTRRKIRESAIIRGVYREQNTKLR